VYKLKQLKLKPGLGTLYATKRIRPIL